MQARHEHRTYSQNICVWVGRYRNLNNLPHWHSDHEIVYAEKGAATVRIGSSTYTVEQGNALFIQSQNVHCIQSDSDCILLLFIFAQKPLQQITANTQLVSPLLSGDYHLPELFGKLSEEINSDRPLAALSANNRTARLLIDIFMNEPVCGADKKGGGKKLFCRLLDDIDKNYANYTLADAARFVSVSQSHFSKMFKKMANTTFTRYLNMVRVEKAIEIMREGGTTITETAISCGFGSIRNFNRVFKEITGYSPRGLPENYSLLSIHPAYTADEGESFDPTNTSSVLL